MRRNPVSAVVLALTLGLTAPLAAQDEVPPTHVSFNAGLFQYDLEGNGLAPMIAVRGATPISLVLMFEAALLVARPDQNFGPSTLIVPEGQVQLALPFTNVIPYMGLGVGAAIDLRGSDGGGTKADLTISGALGIKTWLNETLGAQLEYRGRGIDTNFTGSASEYTLGLIWRI